MGFDPSPGIEVMQQQMDWLLARLMAAQAAALSQSPDGLPNGNTAISTNPPTRAITQHFGFDPPADNSVEVTEASNQQGTAGDHQALEQALEQVAQLQAQLQDVESKLGASQQEVEAMTEHLTQLQSELVSVRHGAEQAESLQQQVTELQGRLEQLQRLAEEFATVRHLLVDNESQPAEQAPDDAATMSSSNAMDRVRALTQQLLSVQAELAATQAAAAEAAASRQQDYSLQTSSLPVQESAQQSVQTSAGPVQESAQQAEPLQEDLAQPPESTEPQEAASSAETTKQQLTQLQAELQCARAQTASLQQQLDDVKSQASVPGMQTGPSHCLSRGGSSAFRQSGEQLLDRPSVSMTTAEADLLEAASNAIQAEVSVLLNTSMDITHTRHNTSLCGCGGTASVTNSAALCKS